MSDAIRIVALAFSPGYACSRRRAIVVSSACACSGETPSRRRPVAFHEARLPVDQALRAVAKRERHPQLTILLVRELEAGRHDADHGVRLAVGDDRLADDPRVCAVAPLPESLAQEHHLVAAALVLLQMKQAADEGLHAERVEELCGDHLPMDELRLAAP